MKEEQEVIDKSLKEKAIQIQGKSYVLVADRIVFFNEQYPNGAIHTEYTEEGDRVTFKATIYPDVESEKRYFTGFSQAVWGVGMVNKTSALENAETSAVGRALAMMGIGVVENIASVDEINKAHQTEKIIDASPECPQCGNKMKMSKAGNPYCPNRYGANPSCPPKVLTDNDKDVMAELDAVPKKDGIPTL